MDNKYNKKNLLVTAISIAIVVLSACMIVLLNKTVDTNNESSIVSENSIAEILDESEESQVLVEAEQPEAAILSGETELSEMTDDEILESEDTVDITENASKNESAVETNSIAKANSSKDFYADIKVGSSWGEGVVYKQFDISIVNNSKLAMEGWTLKVNVGNAASIDTGWSGKYSIAGGIMTVTPESYNATIEPGQRADIGVIIAGANGGMSYTLTPGTTKAPSNQNQQQNQNNLAQNNNQNNAAQNNNQQNSGQPAVNPGALTVPAPTTDDWLSVKGNTIVDSTGKKVWLTGVNWFGYNTGTNTFDGLWNSDLNTSIKGIADHGFNLIRIPISAELILQWKSGNAPMANFNQATNSYLVGMDSLQIFDYVVGQCRANGLKLMIDIHSAETNASGHTVNLWKTSKITKAQYQEALVWMATRYKNDDTIIAYDLKNEPHGKPFEGNEAAIWNNSTAENNWKYVAEETALKVLNANPNVLIMVEGTEIYPINIKTNGDFKSTDEKDYYFNWWGGNLRGVKDYPINLGKYQNKLVYSPHDYGPTVFEQPWFKGAYNYDSLMRDCWHDNWFYIYENGTAPLLIGEWGGFMTEPNITWMTYMRQLIKTNHLNHTFWCFNANSGDTGGLVLDDFTTWDEQKYKFVKEVLWQQNGKFVGLDHKIPLGTAGNGITLTEAKGL